MTLFSLRTDLIGKAQQQKSKRELKAEIKL